METKREILDILIQFDNNHIDIIEAHEKITSIIINQKNK